MCPPVPENTDEQRSPNAVVVDKCFYIVESRVTLLSVLNFGWSYCVNTVLLIERHSSRQVYAVSHGLNFKSKDSLSALEPSDPSTTYIRKCRVLPFRSASVKSKFSIVVENDVILNPYFHSPGSNRGTGNSSCLRKSPSTTCSSFTAQASERFGGDCGIGTTDFPLGVSERKQSISTNVAEREHRCLFRVVSAWKLSCDCGVTRSRSSLASPSNFVKHALGCPDHSLVCFTTRDIAILKTTGQCTSAVVKVAESLCQFVEDFTIQVRPRRSCGTCRSLFYFEVCRK